MTIAEIILSLAVGFLIAESYFRHRQNKKLTKELDELNSTFGKFNRNYNSFRISYYYDKVNHLNETRKDDLILIGELSGGYDLRFEVDMHQADGIIVCSKESYTDWIGNEIYKCKFSLSEFNSEVYKAKTIKEKLCCKKGKK